MIRLFRVSFPPSIVALFVIEAALAFLCYLAVFQIRGSDDWVVWFLYEGGFDRVGLVVGSVVLGIYFNDLYSDVRVTSRVLLVQKFCLVFGMAFMAQAFLSYFSPELILGRWHMIFGSAIGLVVLPSWRIAFDALVLRMLPSRSILFVGTSDLVQRVARQLSRSPHFAMTSVGYLALQPLNDEVPGIGMHLGLPKDLKQVADQVKPDTVVVGLSERRNQLPVSDLLDLSISGTKVEEITSLYENVMWRLPVEAIRPSQMLFANAFGINENSLMIQRFYSFVFALVGTIITSPIMLVVVLLIRATSAGPAIYKQRRVGYNNKEFFVYKFRSMYIDAESRTGAVWATKDDPRITPVGKWLRKLRIDELPQFFNVLKGEMSLVGPRPERPEFVKTLSEQIPYYRLRHAMPPGITGWAQINHKYGDTLEDSIVKLEYDLYYLKNISVSLDLYIIFHTAKVMLLSKGSQ